MVRLPDDDTEFSDITTEALHGILAPDMFILCLDYVLRMSIDLTKENGLTLKKKKATSRQYPRETTTEADYMDDTTLLANIPAQAESLLYNPEEAVGNGLCLNAIKIEYFKQHGAISTLSRRPLKLTSSYTSVATSHLLRVM